MLINHTAEKLRSMKLPAMAAEYLRQAETPDMSALDFDERVGWSAFSPLAKTALRAALARRVP